MNPCGVSYCIRCLVIARYGSDLEEDDSDEESEDENAQVGALLARSISDRSLQEWTNEVEKEFLRCYSIVKQRDPTIYDANTKFFSDGAASTADQPVASATVKKSKEKKMNLKEAEIQYALAEAMNNGEEEIDRPMK